MYAYEGLPSLVAEPLSSMAVTDWTTLATI
jgi:hypothetical protein